MKGENKKIEKICSFYVSNWHLTTMLLPYMNEKIEEKAKIITIFENDIEENIKTLLKKLNLKNEQEILKINWKNFNSKKYEEIAKKLEKVKGKKSNILILVNGSRNYMEVNNENIERYLQKEQFASVKIINFYDVIEFNSRMSQILNSHDKVFNTSGEKEIFEVFGGFHKKEIDEKEDIV